MYAALHHHQLVLASCANPMQKYFCPECQQQVLLITGKKQRAYFRHQNSHFREQETAEHRAAKTLILNSLLALRLPAQTEVTVAKQQLRADVYFWWHHREFAIEIQCAPLSEAEYEQRQQLYAQAGITDIWVLGKKHFVKRKLKQIQLNFVRNNSFWGDYLLEINVSQQKLELIYNLQENPVTRQLLFQKHTFRLTGTGVQELILFRPLSLRKYPHDPGADLQYLLQQARQQTKLGREFAEACYLQQIPLAAFPATALPGFLPIKKALQFRVL